MARIRSLMISIAVTALAGLAQAGTVTLSTGAGSAVQHVDASSDFELAAALNPSFSDGGFDVQYAGGSNINPCGFAGCPGWTGFTGFSGNYLYDVGLNAYIDFKASSGQAFSGFEFITGTGFRTVNLEWSVYNAGVLAGSGTATLAVGTVVGLSGGSFDEVRITDGVQFFTRAPALDNARAQFAVTSSVPESSSLALMLAGLGLVATVRRRRG